VLTLADGSRMVLDSLGNGVVANEQGVKAILKDGQLVYESNGAIPENIAYNTMSTPRGRQFHVQLPDGTHAWLNAASSITFPTAFTGKERKVQITGEVYFEVDPLSSVGGIPFIVDILSPNKGAAGGRIEVLGTHFNINAYKDEPEIKVTLLKGKVRVSTNDDLETAVLQPGEQLSLSQTSHLSQPIPVQTDEVIAWKNGIFYFNNANVPEVMRQLARWYDIDVVYAQGIPDVRFSGKMLRNLNLSQVTGILNKMQVQCRLEAGNKLVISK
jgi:transmembrane sensor